LCINNSLSTNHHSQLFIYYFSPIHLHPLVVILQHRTSPSSLQLLKT
jgi:hypothetical protein